MPLKGRMSPTVKSNGVEEISTGSEAPISLSRNWKEMYYVWVRESGEKIFQKRSAITLVDRS